MIIKIIYTYIFLIYYITLEHLTILKNLFMKMTTRSFFLSLVLFCSISLTSQDTIQGCLFLDFENIEGMNLFEGAEMNNQFEASFGLTFSLEGGGFPVLAEVGGSPAAAFGSAWGNDTPDPQDQALIGNFFLTDDGQLSGLDSPPVILNFATAIDSFAGCILDMDFGEVFKIEAFGEFGNLILEDSIMAGDPDTGDGRATCWGFNLGNCTGMVYEIKFSGYRETAGAFGLGLDNFSFCYAGVNAAVDYVICEGDSLILNDEIYTQQGNYEQLLFTSEGCDSLVFINLEVLPSYERTDDYSFCEGESIEINGVIYDSGGDYTQSLMTAGGCDSIINIAIAEIDGFNIVETYSICEGDSLVINGEVYVEADSYTQLLESTQGCDSILTIQLLVNPSYQENINLSFCTGDIIVYNDVEYSSAGNYQQDFLTTQNCDSTILLTVQENPTYLFTEEYEVCDNETLEVNGIIYDTSGTYQQDYLSILGCDSTHIISVDILPTYEVTESYTLIDGDSVDINGETFNVSGQYVQIITANNGCDSLINIEIIVLPPPDPETVIYYDLNNCSAASGYSEFTATNPETLDCTMIDASIISRTSGYGHSCTPGVNGGQAMCVSSEVSCTYDPDSDYMIGFEFLVIPEAGSATVISNFDFFEKAPEQFEWTTGGSGDNNYPTLYGIRILKNNVEIYRDDAISTNRDWTLQAFDFTGNDDFRITSNANIKIELTPYCTIGSFSTVTAWDIDDLSIRAYCSIASARLYGQVTSALQNQACSDVEMRLSSNGPMSVLHTDDSGLFAFDNLIAPYDYLVEAYDNTDVKNGVSTLDLILIQKHILDIKPFDRPELYIAADVNHNNSVTAIDLIELRKIILGIHDHFPNNTSWRFFDTALYTGSPWEWNEFITVDQYHYSDINFTGIKIGDVNNSFSSLTDTDNRSLETATISYQLEQVNQKTLLHFYATEEIDISGLQMSIDLKDAAVIDMIPGKIDLAGANVFHAEDKLNISYSEKEVRLTANEKWFTLILDQDITQVDLSSTFQNELYTASDLETKEITLSQKFLDSGFSDHKLADLDVYPNPFSSSTQISFTHDVEETLQLDLVDIYGKIVMTRSLLTTVGHNEIMMSNDNHNLPAGIYIIQIHTRDHSASVKVVRL